jgi:hypothetical protein
VKVFEATAFINGQTNVVVWEQDVGFQVNCSNHFLSWCVTSVLCTVIINSFQLKQAFQFDLIYWKNKCYFFTIKSYVVRLSGLLKRVSHKIVETGYYEFFTGFFFFCQCEIHNLHYCYWYYYYYYVVIFVFSINKLFWACVPLLERSFPRFSTSVLQRM